MLRDPDTGRGPAVCGCGMAAYTATEVTLARDGEGGARASGTHRCDSLWLCPVCTFRRAKEVQERARRLAEKSIEAGAWVFMVTLTVRHDLSTTLEAEKRAVSAAFRKAQQGKIYERLRSRDGMVGAFRTMEVRYSTATGWHLHIHALVPVIADDVDAARGTANRMVGRYLDRLGKEGMDAVREGQDVTLCYDPQGAGQYAAKGALEVSLSEPKRGKTGSLHPFELLAQADEGDARARRLFIEYARTMPGTPQGRITDAMVARIADQTGDNPAELATYLRHGSDEDNDELVEEPEAGEDEAVATVAVDAWNRLHVDGRDEELLGRIEDGARFNDLVAEGWPVRPPVWGDPPDDPTIADVCERLRSSGTLA
jgi:hypothetical protein